MTTYRIGVALVFTAKDRDHASFEAVLSRFYDELLDTEERETDIIDPDVTASLAELTADVDMGVAADSLIDAQVRAISLIRAALHAHDVATPGWEAEIAGIVAPSRCELQDA